MMMLGESYDGFPAFREEMQRLTSSDNFKSALDRVSGDIEVSMHNNNCYFCCCMYVKVVDIYGLIDIGVTTDIT